jgi:hypothetical protein
VVGQLRLKIVHNLHNLHKLFLFSAQQAVKVILILFQTYTTIQIRKIVDTSHGGQVHHQTFPALPSLRATRPIFFSLCPIVSAL